MATSGMRSQLAQETRRRITFLGVFLGVVGLVLTVRVGYWQLRGVTYVDPTRSLVLQPLRGSIVDANGRYLVANSVIYTVGISPHLLTEADREGYLRLLTEVLGMEEREAGTVLDSRQPYVQLGTDDVGSQVVEITITPTYGGCPAMDQIRDDIVGALAQTGWKARVTTRLAPAWTTDWISALTEATLKRPSDAGYITQGKNRQHSEHLGYVLGDMQVLARQHPGAQW